MTGLPPELLSAVLASPEDDAPRLACADWLDEHGRPEDAALMRASVDGGWPRELSAAEARRVAADVSAAGWVVREAELERGFLSRLVLKRPANVSAASLACLAGHPLLGDLELVAPPLLPPTVLRTLPPLPHLHALTLGLDQPREDDALREALAALPSLCSATVAFSRPGAERYSSEDDDWLAEMRSARLREGPVGEIPARLEAAGAEVRRTQCGLCAVDTSNSERAGGELDVGAIARLPGLAALTTSGGDLSPDAPAAMPGVVALQLDPASPLDPAALARAPRLRHLGLFRLPGDPEWLHALWNALEALPNLETLTLGMRELRDPWPGLGRPLDLPGLRVLRVIGPWEVEADAPRLIERSDDAGVTAGGWWADGQVAPVPPGPAESCAGVTVRAPEWFARVPTPPGRDGVAALAAWAEWGDGGVAGRLDPLGPTRVTLERFDTPYEIGTTERVLFGPPGQAGAAIRWDRVREARPPGGPPSRRVSGECAFAHHRRSLWSNGSATLLLRAEASPGRAATLDAVFGAVADSLRVG